jgi:hypothetical protein
MTNSFRRRELPEPARLAGYVELMDRYALRVPLPPSSSRSGQEGSQALDDGIAAWCKEMGC